MGFWSTITSPVRGIVNGLTGGGGSAMGEMDPEARRRQTAAYERDVERNIEANRYWGMKTEAERARLAGRAAPTVALPGATAAASMDPSGMSAAGMDLGQQDQFRARQMGLIDALNARASGVSPSAAEISGRRMLEGNLNAIRSAAASQTGGLSSGNLRAALGSMGRANLEGGAQIMQQRAAEQAAAEQAMAGVLGQGRGADIGIAAQQAGFGQEANLQNALMQQQASQANAGWQQQALQADADRMQQGGQFNAQMQMQNQQQIDRMTQYYINAGMDATQAELRARQDAAAMFTGQYASAQQAATQDAASRRGIGSQILGGFAAGAGMALLSDRRAKTRIRESGRDVDEFLGALRAYEFDYIKDEHGGRQNYGFMAQDAERSRAGKTLVVEADDGTKMIDSRRALMMALASAARLNERLSAVEAAAS